MRKQFQFPFHPEKLDIPSVFTFPFKHSLLLGQANLVNGLPYFHCSNDFFKVKGGFDCTSDLWGMTCCNATHIAVKYVFLEGGKSELPPSSTSLEFNLVDFGPGLNRRHQPCVRFLSPSILCFRSNASRK
jgi:hypothetical protein